MNERRGERIESARRAVAWAASSSGSDAFGGVAPRGSESVRRDEFWCIGPASGPSVYVGDDGGPREVGEYCVDLGSELVRCSVRALVGDLIFGDGIGGGRRGVVRRNDAPNDGRPEVVVGGVPKRYPPSPAPGVAPGVASLKRPIDRLERDRGVRRNGVGGLLAGSNVLWGTAVSAGDLISAGEDCPTSECDPVGETTAKPEDAPLT